MTSAHDDPIDTLTADAIRLARLGQTGEARERVDRAHRSVGAAARSEEHTSELQSH